MAQSSARCPVCGKLMPNYLGVARHMTHTAEAYPQHVDFVERVTGDKFLSFAIGKGGVRRLADILEKGRKAG